MKTSIQTTDGCWLAGQLDNPSFSTHGILVTVHGSFLQDRNGDFDSSRQWMYGQPLAARGLFRSIADIAQDSGMACFRYDKRASGLSEGVYAQTDVATLADDLICVVRHLTEQFPDSPIFVLGHSEGALTTMTAERMGLNVDGIVLNSPWVGPLKPMLSHQIDHFGAQFLRPKPTAEDLKSMPYLKALYTEIFHGDLLTRILETDIKQSVLSLRPPQTKPFKCLTNLQKYRQYDQNLMDYIASSSSSIHIVQGTNDANINTRYLKKLPEISRVKCGEPLAWTVLDGLDHSFRRADAKDSISETFSLPLDSQYASTLSRILTSWRERSVNQFAASIHSRQNEDSGETTQPRPKLVFANASDLALFKSCFSFDMTNAFQCPGPRSVFEDATALDNREFGKPLVFRVLLDDAEIGCVWFDVRRRHSVATFYLSLLPEFRMRGLARSITQKIKEKVFLEWKLHRLETGIAEENTISIRGALSMGMQQVGCVPDGIKLGDSFEDLRLFSMCAKDMT